jgi:hypothetical protein
MKTKIKLLFYLIVLPMMVIGCAELLMSTATPSSIPTESGATTAPSLNVTQPSSATSWPINSAQQIRWTTSGGDVAHVNLAYAVAGITTTIEMDVANSGVYTWTTPPTATTLRAEPQDEASARVRVESTISPTLVYDVSEAFTLYDPGTLTNTVYLSLVLNNQAPGLIQPSDLVYVGAFRLPDVPPGTPEGIGWEWGGSAMAYYPDGDPAGPDDGYPGSIFGTGHNWNQYISEINIPVPVVSLSQDVNDLNTAGTLQEFQNVRGNLYDGRFEDWEIPRVGLVYLPRQGSQTTDKLYFGWGVHLQELDDGPSHGWCELDLSNPQPAGIWRIGGYVNYVSTDYMFEIPQAWADAYTPGQYLATGRFRDGGQGAEGPSLIAYGPWNEGNPPAPDSTLSATPLILYGSVYEENPPAMNDYHHSDEWSGAAWLSAGNDSAVIFVGTKGQGECWYGCADGTDAPPWPDDCNRGWWSTSFVGQMLFYDPSDLAAVAQGEMQPFEPQPYATLDLDPYLYHIASTQQWYHVGAADFDRERGLLYIFEPLADGDKPLLHVWRAEP